MDGRICISPSRSQQGDAAEGVVYLYFDEAGDLNFKDNGSRLFMITCAVMRRPFNAAPVLMRMKYDLLEEGIGEGYFHAREDNYRTRGRVFDVIVDHSDDFAAYTFMAHKASFRELAPKHLYQQLFSNIFREMDRNGELAGARQVIAITDALPNATKKGDIHGQLAKEMKACLPEGARWRLIHQRSEGDINLQIVDYLCWARFRLEEHGDSGPFERVSRIWKNKGEMVPLRVKISDLPT